VITDVINFDPSIVTITRHTKVKHAGGFSWTESTLAPMTCRLYFYSTRNQREVTLPEGEVKTIILGLLVDGVTADIMVGHDSYDTFTFLTTGSPSELREYRIVGVRRYDDVNIDLQTQADCVAV